MEQMSQSRSLRLAFISLLLAALSFMVASTGRTAYQPEVRPEQRRPQANEVMTPLGYSSLVAEYHGVAANTDRTVRRLPASNQPGIHEEVPEKYRPRYQQWKSEFLATETGRQQWEFYQNNPNFSLTIVVTRDNQAGGTTSNYKWNQAGELIAATITLGCRLDVGVPNPVYFPVMNSLVPSETAHRIEGQTLAATKMAHEFGHVNRTAKGDPVRYQLQGQLMPQYNQIFLSNGRNVGDPRLVDMATRMGGTPVEIWEDREYWGETNAMLYLRDRFAEDAFRCLLFSRIKRSVDLYAPSYEERFLSIAQSTPAARHCNW